MAESKSAQLELTKLAGKEALAAAPGVADTAQPAWQSSRVKAVFGLWNTQSPSEKVPVA
jgi:hypothetical protein